MSAGRFPHATRFQEQSLIVPAVRDRQDRVREPEKTMSRNPGAVFWRALEVLSGEPYAPRLAYI